MTPFTLVAIDFDGTLYNSKGAPTKAKESAWFHQAKSLEGFGAPGFDKRWILPIVIEARRATQRMNTYTILLTARVYSRPMEGIIQSMLKAAEIPVDEIMLRPLNFPGSSPEFKSAYIAYLLQRFPSVQVVQFYDDLIENHDAVGQVVRQSGRKFSGVLAPGFSPL